MSASMRKGSLSIRSNDGRARLLRPFRRVNDKAKADVFASFLDRAALLRRSRFVFKLVIGVRERLVGHIAPTAQDDGVVFVQMRRASDGLGNEIAVAHLAGPFKAVAGHVAKV